MSRRCSSLVILAVLVAAACGPAANVVPDEAPQREAVSVPPCPPLQAAKFEHSPFGLHAAGGSQRKANDLNAAFVRKIVLWQQGEPQPGRYLIVGGDTSIREIQAAGLDLVVTLRTTSRWGVDVDYEALTAERPNHPWTRFSGPPRDMSAWLNFVRAVVERFDGDGVDDMPGLQRPIRYWQIGNEVRWQWQGTLDQYQQLLHETARVIRQTDPQARIVLAAITGLRELAHDDFARGPEAQTPGHRKTVAALSRVLTDASNDYDIVDFHSYDDDPMSLATQVCWLRQHIDSSKEIWTLENAGPFDDFTTARCSEDIVKRHLIALAWGVKGFFWSSLNPTTGWSEPYQRLALLDEAHRITPAYLTYRLLTTKLQGLTSLQVLDTPASVHAFRASTRRGDVLVAWCDSGECRWELPVEASGAEVTHIITSLNQINPQTETVRAQSGVIVLTLTPSPVFIEPLTRN